MSITPTVLINLFLHRALVNQQIPCVWADEIEDNPDYSSDEKDGLKGEFGVFADTISEIVKRRKR